RYQAPPSPRSPRAAADAAAAHRCRARRRGAARAALVAVPLLASRAARRGRRGLLQALTHRVPHLSLAEQVRSMHDERDSPATVGAVPEHRTVRIAGPDLGVPNRPADEPLARAQLKVRTG